MNRLQQYQQSEKDKRKAQHGVWWDNKFFDLWKKIEQIIKEKGVEACGIEEKVYSKICALQFAMPKMEQFLPE